MEPCRSIQSFGVKISRSLPPISFCTTSTQTACYFNMGEGGRGKARFCGLLSHAGVGELGLDGGQYACKLINGSYQTGAHLTITLKFLFPLSNSHTPGLHGKWYTQSVDLFCTAPYYSTIFIPAQNFWMMNFNIDSDCISNFSIFEKIYGSEN